MNGKSDHTDTCLASYPELDALLLSLEAALDASDRDLAAQRALLNPVFVPDYMRKICQLALKGLCQHGGSCKDSHDTVAKARRFCKAFADNKCQYNVAECPYSHEINRKKLACKYFGSGECLLVENCAYSHDPNARIRPPKQKKKKTNDIAEPAQKVAAQPVQQLPVQPSFAAFVQNRRDVQKAQKHKPAAAPSRTPITPVAAENREVQSLQQAQTDPGLPETPKSKLEKQIEVAEEKVRKGMRLSEMDRIWLEARSALDEAKGT
jgi:hypothetical protein